MRLNSSLPGSDTWSLSSALVSQYRGPGAWIRFAARCSRHRTGRRLNAVLTILFDRRGERRIEDRHLLAERREIGNTLAAPAIRRDQLGHRTAALGDHDLPSLLDLVEQGRQILAGFADAGGAHAASVLHVAHRGQPVWGAPKWPPIPPNVRSAPAQPGRSSTPPPALGAPRRSRGTPRYAVTCRRASGTLVRRRR